MLGGEETGGGVERQAQNRARAVSEGFKSLDGAGGGGRGEDV